MPNIYDFRPGHSLKNVNPQAAGLELEKIRAEKGTLKPADVVEAARDPASPLHEGFEWDDSAAAHQHRLTQARRLIVSVRVINSPVQANVPAFVSVRTPDHGRNYVPTVEALGEEQIKLRILQEARQFIEGLQRRYAHFEEAAALIAQLRQKIA